MSKRLWKTAAIFSSLALLAACGGGSDTPETDSGTETETTETEASAGEETAEASDDTRGTEEDPFQLGVTDSSQPKWQLLAELAAEEDIYFEGVNFTDYQQPNPALSIGDLDINQFQHIQFLAQYNVANDDDLVPIGTTAVYPLPLYSNKWDSIEDIPEGGEIVVPNDPTNQARALLVLEEAGLVTLTNSSTFSTLADVDRDASKVEVTAVDAKQTASTLLGVDGAVVNNNFAADAGLNPEDAIFEADTSGDSAKPYVNIWVVRAEDSNNEKLLRLAELYHTPEVQEAEQEQSNNTAVFFEYTNEELQEILEEIQAALVENS